jgi:hypothetical protein
MHVPGNTPTPTVASLEELLLLATQGTDTEKDQACAKLARALDYNFDLHSTDGMIGFQCFQYLNRIIENKIPHKWLSQPSYMAVADYLSRCVANK